MSNLEYGDALRVIGSLSAPSKMPWWGWSISANDCITGSKLAKREGTICSDCYALKGRYLFPNVKVAHDRRKAALDHPQFVEAFALVLNTLYMKTKKTRIADGTEITENRFRWMDSGDLQSVKMLQQINDIALRTPKLLHWLPTREVRIVKSFLEGGGELAPNLVVRISAPLVGKAPNRRILGLPTSTVGVDGSQLTPHQCRALEAQGNRCLDCDRCWKPDDINYPLH